MGLALVASLTLSGVAVARADAPANEALRIVVAGSKPFIITHSGKPRGVALDVWRAIATRLGIKYSVRAAKSVAAGIGDVAGGRADVLVGPVSITAKRAERVDFTQPYFASSIAILTSRDPPSTWKRIGPVLKRAFLIFVLGLLVVLFVVGNLVWLAERKHNPAHFPRSYLRGVGNGMWFAIVTMTTVGYGDRTPITRAGRVLAGIWMLVAMVGASSLTASIATLLTVSKIEDSGISSMAKMRNRRVAAVSGTPGELVAQRYGARVVLARNKDSALGLLVRGKVEAMLYDLPVLQYYLLEHPNLPLVVHTSQTAPDNYGFAVRRGSVWRNRIDVALLKLREARVLRTIMQRWHVGQHDN